MAAIGKKCEGTSGEHEDGETLVEYLMALGGGQVIPTTSWLPCCSR